MEIISMGIAPEDVARFEDSVFDADDAPPITAPLKLVPKVTVLETVTTHDIPTERILDAAKGAELQGCVVVGQTPEGEFYFASSFADGGTALWWLEKAKKALLDI